MLSQKICQHAFEFKFAISALCLNKNILYKAKYLVSRHQNIYSFLKPCESGSGCYSCPRFNFFLQIERINED